MTPSAPVIRLHASFKNYLIPNYVLESLPHSAFPLIGERASVDYAPTDLLSRNSTKKRQDSKSQVFIQHCTPFIHETPALVLLLVSRLGGHGYRRGRQDTVKRVIWPAVMWTTSTCWVERVPISLP